MKILMQNFEKNEISEIYVSSLECDLGLHLLHYQLFQKFKLLRYGKFNHLITYFYTPSRLQAQTPF